jgi:endo-1,4-beta-xylanase
MKKFNIILLAILLLAASSCSEEENSEFSINETPLKDIYKNDFLIGNIINETYMSGNYLTLLKHHYNTVTCENDMKPERLAPTAKGGNYNWKTADDMVNAMIAAGMKVHGHTLVWHRQTPSWMTNGSKEDVQANLETYIKDVIKHFEGRVMSWDVVNEVIRGDFTSSEPAPTDWKGSYLRQESPWYKELGDDYIEIAFKAAREAAGPDVKLYYNDYGLNVRNKGIAVYNMIKDINERYAEENNGAKLIDGMGMQGHYGLYIPDETRISGITYYDNVEFALKQFISLGIVVDISELDIVAGIDEEAVGKNSKMSDSDAKKQAEVYAKLFKLFLENKEHITRVTMWGMDDANSWKSRGNPCLFNGSLSPKPAFFAVSDPSLY